MKKKRTFFTTLYLSLLCFFIFSTHSSQATTITSDNSQTATTDSSLSLSDSGQEAMELRLLDNPVVTFLLEHLKINKPTVFAIGITTIGLIFLIMSLFLPSLAKQQR